VQWLRQYERGSYHIMSSYAAGHMLSIIIWMDAQSEIFQAATQPAQRFVVTADALRQLPLRRHPRTARTSYPGIMVAVNLLLFLHLKSSRVAPTGVRAISKTQTNPRNLSHSWQTAKVRPLFGPSFLTTCVRVAGWLQTS
jgi:hypothetical protein